MVAVTVQPYTPAMGAQRRTFVLAVLLNQIVADKDLAMVVAQSFLRFHHRPGQYNLVEQVPLAAIQQSSHALILQYLPPGL